MEKFYCLPQKTEITGKLIKNLIESDKRKQDRAKFKILADYYANKPVTLREAPNKLLAITNFARYITKINVGYLLGSPVNYLSSEDIDIESLNNSYRKQAISNLDVELATHASIYGVAYERIYANEESEVRSVKIDPRNIILVHDTTVEHRKMFAIVYEEIINAHGKIERDSYQITILTPEYTQEGTLKGGTLILESDPETSEDIRTEHRFGEVPIVEYLNGSDRMGDSEPVLPLIDAYNILQSDRVIDRERLVDAILAFYGTHFTPEQQAMLKDSRIVANVPQDAKIEYIVKSIDEADADVLRKTIAADIHKISMTPDMSDENFAGNSSGVAILYKLLDFEQHIKDKERYFERSLLERFRIYNSFLVKGSKMDKISTEDIDVIFKRALPQNDLETSQIINNLNGLVDRETLVSQLSFVRDAKETVNLALNEKNEADNTMNSAEITDQNEMNDAKE